MITDAENCHGWDEHYPLSRRGAGRTRVFSRSITAVLLNRCARVDIRFWFSTFFWFQYDSLLVWFRYIRSVTDTMGPNRFRFCLLLIVLFRAAGPSSISN